MKPVDRAEKSFRFLRSDHRWCTLQGIALKKQKRSVEGFLPSKLFTGCETNSVRKLCPHSGPSVLNLLDLGRSSQVRLESCVCVNSHSARFWLHNCSVGIPTYLTSSEFQDLTRSGPFSTLICVQSALNNLSEQARLFDLGAEVSTTEFLLIFISE